MADAAAEEGVERDVVPVRGDEPSDVASET